MKASWNGCDLWKFEAQQIENLFLPRLHPCRFCSAAAFMVVAEEVKNAVQQQKVKFADERHSGVRGITGGCCRRDHDIAEKEPASTDCLPFLLGKGDNISRFIALQIVAIDLTNAPVPDDENRQLSVRTSRDV